MMLGRIILATDGEAHAAIRKTWLTKVFVIGDVISFVMQGAGKIFVSLVFGRTRESDTDTRRRYNG